METCWYEENLIALKPSRHYFRIQTDDDDPDRVGHFATRLPAHHDFLRHQPEQGSTCRFWKPATLLHKNGGLRKFSFRRAFLVIVVLYLKIWNFIFLVILNWIFIVVLTDSPKFTSQLVNCFRKFLFELFLIRMVVIVFESFKLRWTRVVLFL